VNEVVGRRRHPEVMAELSGTAEPPDVNFRWLRTKNRSSFTRIFADRRFILLDNATDHAHLLLRGIGIVA
jgi:hypothetical protein